MFWRKKMSDIDRIQSHDLWAQDYDAQVKKYNSYGHDVLFGMCYEFIKSGDSMLDLGIGTGLSSINFAETGLQITGLDGSAEMLKQCKNKGFARELKQYDIQKLPLPYADRSFHHIICCGVLHFFADLLPFFKETVRL